MIYSDTPRFVLKFLEIVRHLIPPNTGDICQFINDIMDKKSIEQELKLERLYRKNNTEEGKVTIQKVTIYFHDLFNRPQKMSISNKLRLEKGHLTSKAE